MPAATTTRLLDRVWQLEAKRFELLRELELLDRKRHAAILAALDAGASLTAVAHELGVSRQALSRYLNRRENHD